MWDWGETQAWGGEERGEGAACLLSELRLLMDNFSRWIKWSLEECVT